MGEAANLGQNPLVLSAQYARVRLYGRYGYGKYRRMLHAHVAHHQLHGSAVDSVRWEGERTHAWVHHFRRLRIRVERHVNIHGAVFRLGCWLIC